MLVCHCEAVYSADVRAAVAAGARDEFDVADLCGAGTRCGGCVPRVTALLSEDSSCAPRCPLASAVRRSGTTSVTAITVVDAASIRVEPARP